MPGIRPLSFLSLSVALLAALAFTGCGGGDDISDLYPTDPGAGGGGGGSFRALNASPATGNADFTFPDITSEAVSIGGVPHTAVRYHAGAGPVHHRISFYFRNSDSAIYSVRHEWGANLYSSPPNPDGITQCWTGGTPCDPAKVSVNQAAKTVRAAMLVLPDAFGGAATSTVDGSFTW